MTARLQSVRALPANALVRWDARTGLMWAGVTGQTTSATLFARRNRSQRSRAHYGLSVLRSRRIVFNFVQPEPRGNDPDLEPLRPHGRPASVARVTFPDHIRFYTGTAFPPRIERVCSSPPRIGPADERYASRVSDEGRSAIGIGLRHRLSVTRRVFPGRPAVWRRAARVALRVDDTRLHLADRLHGR